MWIVRLASRRPHSAAAMVLPMLVLAMLPMALRGSIGAPPGLAVIRGLVVATFMTPFVVPAPCSLLATSSASLSTKPKSKRSYPARKRGRDDGDGRRPQEL